MGSEMYGGIIHMSKGGGGGIVHMRGGSGQSLRWHLATKLLIWLVEG